MLFTKKTLSCLAAARARLLASIGSVVIGFSIKTWKPAASDFKPISAWDEWLVATTTPSVDAAAGESKNSSSHKRLTYYHSTRYILQATFAHLMAHPIW